jgi:hypothetical protein
MQLLPQGTPVLHFLKAGSFPATKVVPALDFDMVDLAAGLLAGAAAGAGHLTKWPLASLQDVAPAVDANASAAIAAAIMITRMGDAPPFVDAWDS